MRLRRIIWRASYVPRPAHAYQSLRSLAVGGGWVGCLRFLQPFQSACGVGKCLAGSITTRLLPGMTSALSGWPFRITKQRFQTFISIGDLNPPLSSATTPSAALAVHTTVPTSSRLSRSFPPSRAASVSLKCGLVASLSPVLGRLTAPLGTGQALHTWNPRVRKPSPSRIMDECR